MKISVFFDHYLQMLVLIIGEGVLILMEQLMNTVKLYWVKVCVHIHQRTVTTLYGHLQDVVPYAVSSFSQYLFFHKLE